MDYPKIEAYFTILQKLYDCYSNFLKIERPVKDLSVFKKHNSMIVELRTLSEGMASWITMPAVESDKSTATPARTDNWVSAPVFSPVESEYVLERMWSQGAELNNDLKDQKLSTTEHFVNTLGLRSTNQGATISTFFPVPNFNACESLADVQTWLSSGDLNVKIDALKPFAEHTGSATSDHAAFAFASFDQALRREDGLTILLGLSDAQHTAAHLAVYLMQIKSLGTGNLPSQQWLDRAKDFKTEIANLASMFASNLQEIVNANCEAGPDDAVMISLRDIFRQWLRPAVKHLTLAQWLSQAFIGFAETSMAEKVGDKSRAVLDLVPQGYQSYCHFAGPTRCEVQMNLLVDSYTSKISELNAAKTIMTDTIKSVTDLHFEGLGVDVSLAMEVARRNYAKANLFIATLGLVNLMFCKSSVRLRTLEAAIVAVKALNVWPFDTQAEETSRIAGLHGIKDALPANFRDEVAQFREKLLRQESLQSA